MDVIFLYAKELNWQENLARVQEILPNTPIRVLDGGHVDSLKDAYQLVFDSVESDYFMMIEGDNYILPECANFLNHSEPTKFWTTNKYGIQYEHGGIKIMNSADCRRQLESNANIYKNFEISANLMLQSNHSVLSEHRFDFSPRAEWVTLTKEMLKLYYWNHTDYLNRWLEHEVPNRIFYDDLMPIMKTLSFSQLFDYILPNLGKIYDSKFNNT